MATEEEVEEKLRNVIDPELDVNIVDLGLVYEINVEDEDVHILMTLTSKACPLHGVFEELVTEEVEKLDEIGDIEVELTFDPNWTPEMMSENARREIGNIPGMSLF